MSPNPRLALLLLLPLGLGARAALGCERPPDVPCELLVERTCVAPGGRVGLLFSMSNMPFDSTAPALDDLRFDIEVSAAVASGGMGWCRGGEGPSDSVIPPTASVVLDDVFSAEADGPTSWVGRFELLLDHEGPRHAVLVSACGDADGDGVCERRCAALACVREDEAPPLPDASFVVPSTCVRPGEQVELELTVRRNGYPSGRPLLVRVLPWNPSDPRDVFPLDPPDISSAGVLVEGDEETIRFACGVHGPCFRGVVNRFDVTISDGPSLLWDSRQAAPQGLGAARVCSEALALSSVVSIDDAWENSRLGACEPAVVRLQLIARNPSLDGRLEELRIEQDLPEGLALVGHELHFHDNPMDSIDPSAASLVATGSVRVEGRRVIVETPVVEPRFVLGGPPVEVFRDLFEADLLLALPAGGLPEGALVLPAARVSGRLGGRNIEASTAELRLPVEAEAPREISRAGLGAPLLVQAPGPRLTWEPEVAGLESYELFRGELSELRPGNYGRCLASALLAAELVDETEPPPGGAWFYLVRGRACERGGSAGGDSLGRARALRASCP